MGGCSWGGQSGLTKTEVGYVMKKFLYGTTALVASGMVAGAASAAEPISLGLSGYYTSVLALSDDDAPGTGDTSVKQDAEIFFSGSTTLDNGLTAGVEVSMEAATAADQIDEHYAYLEGSFGRLEIGSDDGASFKMGYVAPFPTDGHGVDTPGFLHISRASSRTSALITMSADANKITYFTPRFSGFQLGFSYTPEVDPVAVGAAGQPGLVFGTPGTGTSGGGGGGGGLAFGVRSSVNGGIEDILEVAGNYWGKYEDVEIGISLAYSQGDRESAGITAAGAGISPAVTGDPEAYHAGISLSTAGFTVSGAWYESEDLVAGAGVAGAGLPGLDEEAWNLGVIYETGPWKVGVAYLDSETDTPAGTALGGELSLLDLGAQYTLGPGVAIGADLTFAEDEVPNAAATVLSPSSIENTTLALSLLLTF